MSYINEYRKDNLWRKGNMSFYIKSHKEYSTYTKIRTLWLVTLLVSGYWSNSTQRLLFFGCHNFILIFCALQEGPHFSSVGPCRSVMIVGACGFKVVTRLSLKNNQVTKFTTIFNPNIIYFLLSFLYEFCRPNIARLQSSCTGVLSNLEAQYT